MNYKFNRSDLYLFILIYAFAIPISMLDYSEYPEKWVLFAEVAVFGLLQGISLYVFVFVIFPRFFPTGQYVYLLSASVIFFFFMGTLEIYAKFKIFNSNVDPSNLLHLYYGFSEHITEVGLLAAIMLGKKMYENQLSYTKMIKEKRESELRFLKAQIDPHFLFNNLNTVDALIDKDPQVAKEYLNRLSKLYRYLISSKDFEVVPLEEELNFAQNYMYLIESRYGNAYQFEIKRERGTESLLIPPGSLQTLLENIVKHNQASEKQPIHSVIRISTTGISVTNDLRSKNQKVDSTGIGLTNLKARYELLTDKELKINANGQFTVELPLIKQVD